MDDQSKPPLSPGVNLGLNTGLHTSLDTSQNNGLPNVANHLAKDADNGREAPARLYLASQSPRRRELLAQIGITPILLLPDEDEDAEALELTRPAESARDYVERVTHAKVYAAAQRWRRRGLACAPILCADTTVTIDEQILGKPEDAADAARILRLLSGRTHQVLTAVTVLLPESMSAPSAAAPGMPSVTFALSVSNVLFSALDDQTIQRYISSGEPFGKAGAYGIQGHGAAFVAHLSGSYSGVMGLPLFETAQLLRSAGLIA